MTLTSKGARLGELVEFERPDGTVSRCGLWDNAPKVPRFRDTAWLRDEHEARFVLIGVPSRSPGSRPREILRLSGRERLAFDADGTPLAVPMDATRSA